MERRNVFTVPPSVPFLDTLVAALIDGRLIERFQPRAPFALADITLYLPTRRAARAIRERFLARLGRPLLLPRIRTLGDLDEDEAAIADLNGPGLPPAVATLERQLILIRLVLGWSGQLARQVAGMPDEELIVPASAADAAHLASSLAGLMDQVGTDPAAWRGLSEKVPADLARYWDITLTFLRIVTEAWPKHLDERGMIDPGTRRDLMIRREAERLLREGSKAPVIGAGSTGSVPATAALLAAIARLENGAVVLPGLDQGLDSESFEAIAASEGDPAGAGHPQYGLKLLLQTIGVARSDVRPLAEAEGDGRSRDRLVSEAMRPASTAERWIEGAALTEPKKAAATANIGLIEAANEREEALAAAMLLRRAAETPDHIAALVTPDRGMARRVAVELGRWGIDVDDSAGQPLARTSPGIFARLVAETALNGAAGEPLLALLKHPLAAFGLAPNEARRAARSLERAVLRGPRLKPGSAALRHALELRFAERYREGPDKDFPTEAARELSRPGWEAARDLASRVESNLRPLESLAPEDAIAFPDLVQGHIEATIAAATDSNALTRLFSDEAGEALELFLESLRVSATAGPKIPPSEYPGLFAALMERETVRPRRGGDPRIHIWGALEARLQRVDMIVLGGLNEGTWPSQTRRDPLLARPMREALSLEPPERRIGLAAHDFAQALGQPEVWLTRADRQDGEPRVASRWLQRLTAYAGEELAQAMRQRGRDVLKWARELDRPNASDLPSRPHPSPPVELRPKRLSVTRIETLIRDPYDVYARSVLKLRPFEPVGKTPDAAERGMLIHGVLEDFIRECPAGPYDRGAKERLIALGRAAFDEYRDFPEVMAVWWPRFERIAEWFIRQEEATDDVATRHVECVGEMRLTEDFVLTSRADRLDLLRAGGGVAIIDYKTGQLPSGREVASLAPQLPLEGLIASRGGFEGVPKADPKRIAYYRLTGRGIGGELGDRTEVKRRDGRPIPLDELLATTERRLRDLLIEFAKPEAAYPSNKIPKAGRRYPGDYDHLARISEWIATDQEDEDFVPVS